MMEVVEEDHLCSTKITFLKVYLKVWYFNLREKIYLLDKYIVIMKDKKSYKDFVNKEKFYGCYGWFFSFSSVI